MGFPFLICSTLLIRLLLGTGACFASLSRRNLAAGAFVAVLVLVDVLAVALVDDVVDDVVVGVVVGVVDDAVGGLESVSTSLGFAVSVAFVGKFCTGAGSRFV